MNIITFDIEEWYLESLRSGRKSYYQSCDDHLSIILDKLDKKSTKATFFCLGGMAREFPEVIKQIQSRGHEIGCHSDRHLWLKQMSAEELKMDTRNAIDSLEQLTGKKVLSYRAPAFTIGKDNLYAVEVLAECGIEYDSSIFPARHSVGGFPEYRIDTPSIIKYNGHSLKEFPIPMANILNKKIAFSGGGYFRLLPYWFVKRTIAHRDYNMMYFHLSDTIKFENKVMSKEAYEDYFKVKGTLINRYSRYLKTNIGKGNSFQHLCNLIDTFELYNIANASKQIDWNSVPVKQY